MFLNATAQTSSGGRTALPALAVAVLVTGVYRGALDNGFVDWDDTDYVTGNPLIRSLSPAALWRMLTAFHAANWHPLTWFSHALDYRLFGLNPAGHHLTSVLWHAANAVLILVLFRRLAESLVPEWRGRWETMLGGAVAALAFAVHPLRTESVAWVSERKDVLCAFFYFLSVYFHLRARDCRNGRWTSASLASFVLALLAKPMAVTLPLVLTIVDGMLAERPPGWREWIRIGAGKWMFWLLAAAVAVITVAAQKSGGAVVSAAALSPDARIANAARGWLFYIQATLWPAGHVAPLHPYEGKTSLADAQSWAALLVVGALSALALWLWRRGRRGVSAVWWCYLAASAPVIGLVQVGAQAVADRYSYLPTLGFYLLAGGGIAALASAGVVARATATLVSLAVLATASALTLEAVTVWRDSKTLWTHIERMYPGRVARAQFSLAKIAESEGRVEEAERGYRQALDILPGDVSSLNALGALLVNAGRAEEGEAALNQALAAGRDAKVLTNLGLLFLEKRSPQRARELLQEAVMLEPENVAALNNLGLAMLRLNLPGEAAAIWNRALRIDFDFAPAHFNLAVLHRNTGNIGPALVEAQAGLSLDPGNAAGRRLLDELTRAQEMSRMDTMRMSEGGQPR